MTTLPSVFPKRMASAASYDSAMNIHRAGSYLLSFIKPDSSNNRVMFGTVGPTLIELRRIRIKKDVSLSPVAGIQRLNDDTANATHRILIKQHYAGNSMALPIDKLHT